MDSHLCHKCFMRNDKEEFFCISCNTELNLDPNELLQKLISRLENTVVNEKSTTTDYIILISINAIIASKLLVFSILLVIHHSELSNISYLDLYIVILFLFSMISFYTTYQLILRKEGVKKHIVIASILQISVIAKLVHDLSEFVKKIKMNSNLNFLIEYVTFNSIFVIIYGLIVSVIYSTQVFLTEFSQQVNECLVR